MQALLRAGTPSHFPCHFGGVAVGHTGNEVDHSQERGVQWPGGVRRAVAQQIENAPILERRCSPAMLFKGRAAERVQQDFQGGVSADFMQCLALVLENFLARHVFGIQHAALCRAVHMLHQVSLQRAGQQGVLLFDKRLRSRIGQVLDGFATQDRQLASARVQWAQLAIGLWQVITDQVEQQRLHFAVLQKLHFQAIFQVDQRVADVVGCLHQVDERVTRPPLFL